MAHHHVPLGPAEELPHLLDDLVLAAKGIKDK